MSMQLMALIKEQNKKLQEVDEEVKILKAKVSILEDEISEHAEHIASLIDPLRRKSTPGRVPIKA